MVRDRGYIHLQRSENVETTEDVKCRKTVYKVKTRDVYVSDDKIGRTYGPTHPHQSEGTH